MSNDSFYITYLSTPSFAFWPHPNEKIPEDIRCPGCMKSHLTQFYINPCQHDGNPRHDGVPAVPYVELLK